MAEEIYTREEAIEILEHIRRVGDDEGEYENDSAQGIAIAMASKALKQENTLDKIIEEIAVLDNADYGYEGYYKAISDTLKIINKYKTESEMEK